MRDLRDGVPLIEQPFDELESGYLGLRVEPPPARGPLRRGEPITLLPNAQSVGRDARQLGDGTDLELLLGVRHPFRRAAKVSSTPR